MRRGDLAAQVNATGTVNAARRAALAFAREVDLTPEEWMAGIRFLTKTGQISTDKRPEFILLSDTLGLSMMIVSLAQARASGSAQGATAATEATVEGPFYWAGAPEWKLGADICEGCPASRRSTWAA